MNLIRKLAKDENYKISLLIALGCFTGLRISDILSLRWKQILGADEFTVIEQKTGKVRIIRLNPQLQQHIKECYEHINPVGINAPILISQKGTIFTVQRINIILKEVKKKYKLKIKNFSCHSLRKTFGRQVYNMNSDNAELALVKLMELFNSDKWAGLSEACLGCGTCTFVCPTCQCYDIKDFNTGNGVQRYRCWDSCMYSDFTMMAAGNNRTTQMQRFRQRFMHKLVYYPANNEGVFGCVGCGRCMKSCPISMNIVKVMKTLGEGNA